MDCERTCGNPCSICIEVLLAVVAATVVGLLFGFGLIPNIVTALWVVFGFAVLNLIFLVVGLYGAVSVGSTQPYIVGRNEPILVGELRANL